MSSVQKQRVAAATGTPVDSPEEVQKSASGEMTGLEQAEGGNIDKIREIIFGGHMRDYDKRFTRLEARLIKEAADLRDDTKRRFEVLETFIKREFEALSERLQTEQRNREEAVQSLSHTLTETGQTLEAKLLQFDESSARAQRDLRTQILDQSRNLSEEIRLKHAEMSSALEREVAELNDDKPSRSHLASMFNELAARLTGDLKIPEI